MKLSEIVQPSCIIVPLQSKDKKGVITELVNCLDANRLLLDKDVAMEAVMQREEMRSTGIGSGIAIPHGKCKATKELVMAVGIAGEPIEFGSVDSKGVDIVLLLVSPSDQTGPHIQALARISKLMLDTNFREDLRNVKCAKEAYSLFKNKEKE